MLRYDGGIAAEENMDKKMEKVIKQKSHRRKSVILCKKVLAG